MSDDDEREKSKLFKEDLLKWNTIHGRENFKVPQIGGKELDLYKLFKEVVSRGGYHSVCDNKQWKEIVNSLDLPASCTSASFTLRNHYNKYLQSTKFKACKHCMRIFLKNHNRNRYFE